MIGATAAFLLAAPHLPFMNRVVVFLAMAATLWTIGGCSTDGSRSRRASTPSPPRRHAPPMRSAGRAWKHREAGLSRAPDPCLRPARWASRREAACARGARRLARRRRAPFVAVALPAGSCRVPDRPRLLYCRVFARRRLLALARRPDRDRRLRRAHARLSLAQRRRGLKAPVALYVAIIVCDAAQATGRATVLRDRAAIAVAAGAILFLVSDMTIALAKFAHVGWPVDQLTLPTYYLAQGLIALCVLPRGRQADASAR